MPPLPSPILMQDSPPMVMATVLLYIGLAGCSILAMTLVMQYDLHRREPWYLMLLAIGLGCGAMFACMMGQDAYIHANPQWATAANWQFSVLAGTTEELAKLAVVIFIALAFRKEFDEALDGLIYGALAGLGAALAESIRILGAPETLTILPREEPIRLLGHLVMGGIGGFGIGLMVRVSRRHVITALACVVAAMSLHTAWDVLAYHLSDLAEESGGSPPRPHYGYTATSIAIMLSGFFFFRMLVGVCYHYDRVPTRGVRPAARTPVGTDG